MAVGDTRETEKAVGGRIDFLRAVGEGVGLSKAGERLESQQMRSVVTFGQLKLDVDSADVGVDGEFGLLGGGETTHRVAVPLRVTSAR